MHSNLRILNATKLVCIQILVIGTILFLYVFANGIYNVVGIGYGVILGGVFIFIMGLF